MNEELIKGIVRLKLEMAHGLIEHLPEKERKEILALGRIVMDAVTEYVSTPQTFTRATDSESIKNIVIE